MSDEKYFAFQRERGVGLFSFRRIPGDEHGLEVMHADFRDCCDSLEYDETTRVCVIEAIGPKACGSFEMAEDYRRWHQSTALLPSIVATAAGLSMPVVIGMDGTVGGPMLELALACDLRLTTPVSRFSLNHIANGLMPFEGGTQRLPRIVGPGKAMDMLLTGAEMDAQSALRHGLVHCIVKERPLRDAVMEIALEMAKKSPTSMRFTKEAVLKGMDMTLEQGVRLEADLYFLMHSTLDRIEGITAFREKRKPEFNGR